VTACSLHRWNTSKRSTVPLIPGLTPSVSRMNRPGEKQDDKQARGGKMRRKVKDELVHNHNQHVLAVVDSTLG
jgi:hypothetical protein